MFSHQSRTLVCFCASLLLTGCAVGQKIRYHDAKPALEASGTTTVAVAALDDRPYIQSGEKARTYIGTFRGGFGNPFDVMTESGKPLGEDMVSVICAALGEKGFACTPVLLEPKTPREEVARKLGATRAKRLALVTLREWHSDTMVNTSLYYDLTLAITDEQGASLAEKTLKGEDDLQGSAMNPPGHAKEAVPAAYRKKLEQLLNDPAVVAALK